MLYKSFMSTNWLVRVYESQARRGSTLDSIASHTLKMQHRFARCDADWAEEARAIAANRKGELESGDELGQGWGKGEVATTLGKALTTCLPSPASRGDACASAIKAATRRDGLACHAPPPPRCF